MGNRVNDVTLNMAEESRVREDGVIAASSQAPKRHMSNTTSEGVNVRIFVVMNT